MKKNKVYLVSKVLAYSDDTMNTEFKIFANEKDARIYFDKLVDEYKEDSMEYYGCTEEDLYDNFDTTFVGHDLFNVITQGGSEELEIQLEEMEVL